MVKKIIALMFCVSVAVLAISGCAKKAEQPAAEQAAPADSTAAVDSTQAAQ